MSGQHQAASRYFVPAPSRYPVLASVGLLVILASAAGWVNGLSFAPWTFTVGMLGLLLVLRGWFADAIGESEGGHYGRNVDVSYRWSMSWFIFSEVMFFAAFFGALFYARNFALPQLAGLDAKLLWPDFTAVWPTLGPAGVVDKFGTMGPWPIPTLNTALLLSSGVTITIAHHALRANQRARAAFWLFLTICLGVTFLGFQGFEYFHAYHELNMKLTSGIYGSTFFLLTGFHGFHVMMGTVMLSVMLIRILKGHFTPEHHFGFEGAA